MYDTAHAQTVINFLFLRICGIMMDKRAMKINGAIFSIKLLLLNFIAIDIKDRNNEKVNNRI
jgi:hypothetical protein